MNRLRTIVVDLMIDLTILQEMAVKQQDRRKIDIVERLLTRLHDSAAHLKGVEKNGDFILMPAQMDEVEQAHRAFVDSYDTVQAERAVARIDALFTGLD